jgi:predicted GIY-YIG superfamily endonuclease
MPYCYSLNLEGGRKYVGMTNDIDRRLEEHFTGSGSEVTKACPPISVNHIQQCRSSKSARKAETIVYENMRDYHGLDKVRGAGHTRRFAIDEEEELTPTDDASPTSGRCFRCGRHGHFAAECYASIPHATACNTNASSSSQGRCFRCGRYGHFSTSCYARTNVSGMPL